jgi:hypothetical protein
MIDIGFFVVISIIIFGFLVFLYKLYKSNSNSSGGSQFAERILVLESAVEKLCDAVNELENATKELIESGDKRRRDKS